MLSYMLLGYMWSTGTRVALKIAVPESRQAVQMVPRPAFTPAGKTRLMRRSAQYRAQGFTLIELLIVVSIIGLLAALAIPRVTGLKSRAIDSMLRSDLRTLAAVQETYYEENLTYASNGALTVQQFRPSENVTVTIDSATVTGWGAHADHPGTTLTCFIAYAGGSNAAVTCS